MGTLAFRASLEVTDHPRCGEVCDRLLPWLEQLGIGEEIDPIEREILATHHGRLVPSQRTDAYWPGEGAAIYCWALGLTTQTPSPCVIADHHAVINSLHVLRPEAQAVLEITSTRGCDELQAYCKRVMTIRSELQRRRVADVEDVLLNVLRQKLAVVGLQLQEQDLEDASKVVDALSDDERKQAAGLSFVREYAAMWLFDSRPQLFA
jgi:hypothetical protein